MEARTVMTDCLCIFCHFSVQKLIGITVRIINCIIITCTDTASAAFALIVIDHCLLILICNGITSAFLCATAASDYHGANGLGNVEIPRSQEDVVEESAVFFMKKLISELPEGEKITLICTAPLTNVALLLKVFPEVKEKIQEILLMGGAVAGGNVTASAEFNIYEDPESARIVFRSGIPVVMCGLDATEKCALTASQVEKMCQSNNRIARFCGNMAGYSLANGNKYRGNVSIHDAVPFMYLTHPELFVAKKAVLDVECSDCASRGRTICDFRWWQHEESEENVVLMDADGARFQEYLIEAIYELGEKLQ